MDFVSRTILKTSPPDAELTSLILQNTIKPDPGNSRAELYIIDLSCHRVKCYLGHNTSIIRVEGK